MQQKHKIEITTRDRVMRAWENSMDLARNYELCAKDIQDNSEAAQAFFAFAEEEALHAARFKEILNHYNAQNRS